jgi:hypothetical protein
LIGERDNVSGRDLLVALAVGFEVTTRVGVGSDYPAVRGATSAEGAPSRSYNL